MTDSYTSISCLEQKNLNRKSSLAPDETIELPVLRNPPVDINIQPKQQEQQLQNVQNIQVLDSIEFKKKKILCSTGKMKHID